MVHGPVGNQICRRPFMKKLILAAILSTSISAHAELSVVTMSLTETNPHVSKFDPAETFELGGLLIRTTDGANECMITSKILKASNTTGIEFGKHLADLNSSKNQFLLSCYTQEGAVTQTVVTKNR